MTNQTEQGAALRNAFEAWALSRGWAPACLNLSVIDGCYSWNSLNDSWDAFQAGQAARPTPEGCGSVQPATFNEWFLAQPEGRIKALQQAGKWELADAAYKAGIAAATAKDAKP